MNLSKPTAIILLGFTLTFLLVFKSSAQDAVIYPGSTVEFYSYSEFSSSKECPEGGDQTAFNRFAYANGWQILEAVGGTGFTTTGTGSRYSAVMITVHPKDGRMRRWDVGSTRTTSPDSGGLFFTSCQSGATLEAEVLTESLVVDIGIKLIGRKLRPGEYVAPITVHQPLYCNKRWPTTSKNYGAYQYEPIDCESLGMSPDVNKSIIYQTVNLPEKEQP